jgi:hypothetical protein
VTLAEARTRIDKPVTYTPPGSLPQFGVIERVDQLWVWVVFDPGSRWNYPRGVAKAVDAGQLQLAAIATVSEA